MKETWIKMCILQKFLLFVIKQPSYNNFSFVPDYLCKPEENIYEIDFTRFKIRDMKTNTVLFEIAKPTGEFSIIKKSYYNSWKLLVRSLHPVVS